MYLYGNTSPEINLTTNIYMYMYMYMHIHVLYMYVYVYVYMYVTNAPGTTHCYPQMLSLLSYKFCEYIHKERKQWPGLRLMC